MMELLKKFENLWVSVLSQRQASMRLQESSWPKTSSMRKARRSTRSHRQIREIRPGGYAGMDSNVFVDARYA